TQPASLSHLFDQDFILFPRNVFPTQKRVRRQLRDNFGVIDGFGNHGCAQSCRSANTLILTVSSGFINGGPRVLSLAAFPAKHEATSNNHFQDEVICAAFHSDAYPNVELPLRRDIEVDGGKDLMRLFALGVKTAQRSERSVILDA